MTRLRSVATFWPLLFIAPLWIVLEPIVANTNQYLLNGVNFAVLPGDNANEGSESEYQLIKAATAQLKVPLYAVPGDHDRHDLAAYEKYMESRPYYSFSSAGYHFAFLDVMGDIDGDEKAWLTSDLAQAKAAGLKNVIFAHTYNVASDLADVISRDASTCSTPAIRTRTTLPTTVIRSTLPRVPPARSAKARSGFLWSSSTTVS